MTLPETGLATTPKNFLLSTPRGAYTTAQVWDGFLVVDWDVHVERLARSIQALYDATGCSLFKNFVAHVLRSVIVAFLYA